MDSELLSADAAVERRDEVVAAVREHAGELARSLARLDGGEYGRRSFSVDAGEWTVKYEDGGLDFLRFEGNGGLDVYVVSTKRDPEPEPLARAIAHYDGLVRAFNDYVSSMRGTLDAVSTDFPDSASTGDIVAERDRIVSEIRSVANRMAGELHRYDGGDYGSFASRVAGARWELKYAEGRASYLRAGDVYLVGQYGPPSAPDVRRHGPDVPLFVEAYNDHVRELSDALETISIAETDDN